MTALGTAPGDRRVLPEGRLAGPMPWVIGIMTFLTVLAAASGIALGRAAAAIGDDLAGRLTVQIVEANMDVRARQTRAAVAELSRLSGVVEAVPVDDERMRALLSPYFAADDFGDDLPVPALIDVKLSRPGAISADELRAAIAPVAPSARVDANAQWLAPLTDVLGTVRWLAVALVALMAAATSAAVTLASRAAMNTHRETIETMHLMGATDKQVARLFERRAALDALTGSLGGFVLGALIVLFVGGRLQAVGAALLAEGGLGQVGWLALALLPPAAVLLAIATARLTVTRALAKLL